MNVTEAQLLKQYMNPHYQDDDEARNVFLQKYNSASLAASRMWGMLAGKLASDAEIKKISDGAESMEFTSAQMQYTNAMKQSEYYRDLYDSETGNSTGAVAPTQTTPVAGILSTEDYVDAISRSS